MRHRTWLFAIALCATILVVSGCVMPEGDVSLSQEEMDAAVHAVQRILTAGEGETVDGDLPGVLKRQDPREVFVSIHIPGANLLQAGYKGKNILEGIVRSTIQIKNSKDYAQGGFDKLGRARIQVDVLSAKRSLAITHPRYLRRVLQRGLDGVMMTRDDAVTCLLPSYLYLKQVPRQKTPAMLEKGQGIRIKNDPPSSRTRFHRFRTFCFIEREPGGKAIPLYRSNYLLDEIDSQSIMDACVRGGKFLVNMQRRDGSFYYIYNPVRDKRNERSYNLLRHAGTTYCLYQLYGETRDPAFLMTADRALDWLKSKIRTDSKLQIAYPVYHRKAKLGGAGLSMLALVERVRATGEQRDMELMKRLARYILHMQHENGSFDSYYQYDPDREIKQRKSIYYPGEALLGLIRFYGLDPNEKWLEATTKGADFLVHERWRLLGVEITVPPDAWLMMALAELYPVVPDHAYADYCFKIGSGMIADQFQEKDAPFIDYVGGYLPSPPSVTPAGSRMEGLTAAFYLRKHMGLDTGEYFETIRYGCRFQVNCQIRPETAFYFPRPNIAEGIFRQNVRSFKVRIDYNQHNISSLLVASKILREQGL